MIFAICTHGKKDSASGMEKSRINVNRTKCMQEIVCGCSGKPYEQVGHILCECGAYQVEEIEKGKTYVAIHTEAEHREKWCIISYRVTVLDGGDEFECDRGQFAHMGLLCSHVLKVLDFIRVTEIPKKHILKRWTKDARAYRLISCSTRGTMISITNLVTSISICICMLWSSFAWVTVVWKHTTIYILCSGNVLLK